MAEVNQSAGQSKKVTEERGSKKVYFPGLNGLRFFAATSVVLQHTEHIKKNFGLPLFEAPFMEDLGGHAVNFFFVLSGFLITYLLFEERRSTGDINIKDFYLRRILRIWPLYYFIMLLAFFVLPLIPVFHEIGRYAFVGESLTSVMLLYLFFLPNLSRATLPAAPFAYQSWSIGVEEQFYLIWPLLIKKARKALPAILSVIVLFLILKLIAIFLISSRFSTSSNYQGYKFFFKFLSFTRLQCMAVGGLCAYVIFNRKDELLRIIYLPVIQILNMATILIFFFLGNKIQFFNLYKDEFFACLFGILILNVSTNPKSIMKLEYKALDFLGKISYGIYMYHLIGVTLGILLFRPFLPAHPSLALVQPLCYISGLGITILMAALSYKYFEKPFIKMKLGYTKIVSGENAKDAGASAQEINLDDEPVK